MACVQTAAVAKSWQSNFYSLPFTEVAGFLSKFDEKMRIMVTSYPKKKYLLGVLTLQPFLCKVRQKHTFFI